MCILKAVEAGVDGVDTAMSPLALGTSHAPTESIVATFKGTEYDTGLDLVKLNVIRDYFMKLRKKYIDNGLLDPSMLATNTNALLYQVPGGMLSNLLSQLKQAGKADQLDDVLKEVPKVRKDAGYPPLVTPTSQIVGTQAVFNVIMGERYKTVTKEFKGLVKGEYGKTPVAIDPEFQKKILGAEEPITCRPGDLLPPVDWDQLRREIVKFYPNYEEPRSLISYAMYPKVYEEFISHRKEYGYIMRMGSHVFFNGMAVGEMNKINIEDGKTLMIKYIGLGDRNDDGTRNVQFELNGMRREVAVPDPTATDTAKTVVMADPNDKSQAGASIPGMVSKVNVKPGDQVKVNDVLAVIEAMKMETSVVARMDGTIDEVFVKGGQSVKAGELLLTIK